MSFCLRIFPNVFDLKYLSAKSGHEPYFGLRRLCADFGSGLPFPPLGPCSQRLGPHTEYLKAPQHQ